MSKKGWIIVLIMTFIVLILWVATDIYLTRPQTPADDRLKKALEPLDPNLDLSPLKQLDQDQKSLNSQALVAPSPTPVPSPSPSPLPSLTPSPSPLASPTSRIATPSASSIF